MAAGPALYRYDIATNRLVTATTDLPIGDIKQIAVSPQYGTDQTLWIGTPDGVWVSHDAGTSFVRAPGFTTFALRSVRDAGSDLFAAGEEGIWRLRGGIWQSLNAKMVGDAATVNSAIAVSPAYTQDHTIFTVSGLANALGASLYRSQDSGDTWNTPLAGLEYINQVILSPDFAQDRRVYLVAVQQIWQSHDSGDTWAKEPYWDFTHQVAMLAASPTFAQDHALVAVGNGIYRSNDGEFLAGCGRAAGAGSKRRPGLVAQKPGLGKKRTPIPGHFGGRGASPLPTPRPGLGQQRQGTDMDTASGGARSAHQHTGDGAKCRRQRRGALYWHLRRQRV